MVEMNWYSLSNREVLEKLETTDHGLTPKDVAERIQRSGPNKLPDAKTKTVFWIFIEQFQSPIIYVLLIAAFIVYAIGDTADSLIIIAVLIINAIVGAVQEGKAQNTLAALKNFVQSTATVVRNDTEIIVPDAELVPGDIVVLREGNKIPADLRLTEVSSLKVDESVLTGESEPVSKSADPIIGDAIAVSEQKNIAFKGTYVTSGMARAVVVTTGESTYIGGISQKLEHIDTEVPLKADIAILSKFIIGAVLIVSVLIFIIGLAYGFTSTQMFATAVAVAVSIIPEGLPVVVTLILATGVYRMSKRNALVKRLQAVEALGQAKIIAVDKTGTITLNQMTVAEFSCAGIHYEVQGNGYEPKGSITESGKGIEPLDHEDILRAGKIAAFTSSATVAYSEDKKEWVRVAGDPTEAALLVFSEKIGFHKDDLVRSHPQLLEIPFDSSIKYHASVNDVSGKSFVSVVGAPEVILDNSLGITDATRRELETHIHHMSSRGLRVLALAYNDNPPETIDAEHLPTLTLLGFVGIRDGLRPEVHEAVERAQAAGVRVVMITGDHVETARAIAAQAHIYRPKDIVITGHDLAHFNEQQLLKKLPYVSVFARVSPEDKLKIIELYKKRGEIIAMTGDGVNDALSLAAADLGVAMGKNGTEVAQAAADIVLLDDNFGNIVSAIEEGRSIYQTIKKVILYLFSTSLGELFTIVIAILLGYQIPLTASQIIWLNFVTDGFLVVALALEPKEKGLLNQQKWSNKIIDPIMIQRMFLLGAVMTVITLALFEFFAPINYLKASTIALTSMAVLQWFNAWNCRSLKQSIFTTNPFQNMYLVAALVIVIGAQIAALYVPFMQKILHTVPLSGKEWLLILSTGVVIIFAEEVRKIVYKIAKF